MPVLVLRRKHRRGGLRIAGDARLDDAEAASDRMNVLIAGAQAWACVCIGPDAWALSPLPDSENVPTNARIRVFGEQHVPGSFEVYEDGLRLADIEDVVRPYGPDAVRELIPASPFRQGATVEVIPPGASTPFLSFSVGTEPDVEPPEWSGAYSVESSVRKISGCGKYRGHLFEWLQMNDDVWDESTLLVELQPLDETHEPVAGSGNTLDIVSWLCANDDSTLERDFHRRYLAHIEDGSGNVSETFEVTTRGPGCGCSAARASLATCYAPLVAGVILRRHRRSKRQRSRFA